jgi:ribosomal protein L37AE/L43A
MNCPLCKAEIPAGGKFCPKCGATASSNITCTHCGEQSPSNFTFCAGCGKSLKSQSQSQQVDAQTQDSIPDFVYLLSEEKMRAISASSTRIPYGYFAVTLVNGVFNGVRDQISSSSSEPSAISEFFRSVSEFARGLVGQVNNDVKTYIVSNCQGLPLISYVHAVKLPAANNATLRFDFWLDAVAGQVDSTSGALGLFIQKTMGTKTKLTSAEFRQVAIAGVQSILVSQPSLNVESQESLDTVIALLQKTTGISGRCTLVKGKLVERRYLEVSKAQRKVHCPQCDEGYSSKVKFCELCGCNMESADWASASELLQSASGEAILLKISLLSNKERDGFSDEQIAKKTVSALGTIIRKFQTDQILDPTTLTTLSLELNKALAVSFNGVLSEFSVIDIRTAGKEWFFKTEALIAEELRKIDMQQRGLAVEERALDFNEAAFALAMRTSTQSDTHRTQALQQRTQAVEIDLDEQALELRTKIRKEQAELDAESQRHALLTSTDLKKEGVENQAEAKRLEREKEKFKRDSEFQREVTSENRTDEIDQAQHEIKLEKTVAQHDIELADLTGDAQSRAKRREVTDNAFESEEQIRLKAAERVQLGNIEEDLQDRQNQRQVDKIKAMAEIETNMAKQDHAFELSKFDGMKHLDAAQILAMQAAELVKAGGSEAAGEIVRSIAHSQADAAGAGIKDDLYKQMMQTKDDAAKLALDAQKTAMDALLKSNEGVSKLANEAAASAVEGYKEAAKVAQTTNEKSMDSMSKVATAAAGRKSTKEEAEVVATTECKNSECDFVFEGKVKKYCPKCGINQS